MPYASRWRNIFPETTTTYSYRTIATAIDDTTCAVDNQLGNIRCFPAPATGALVVPTTSNWDYSMFPNFYDTFGKDIKFLSLAKLEAGKVVVTADDNSVYLWQGTAIGFLSICNPGSTGCPGIYKAAVAADGTVCGLSAKLGDYNVYCHSGSGVWAAKATRSSANIAAGRDKYDFMVGNAQNSEIVKYNWQDPPSVGTFSTMSNYGYSAFTILDNVSYATIGKTIYKIVP
jgi:hypothetical protein